MGKLHRLLFLSLLCVVTACGADNAALPPIQWNGQADVPQAVVTGKMRKTVAERVPAPGSVAAELADGGVAYEWTPSPDYSRSGGGARLADAAITPDASALVLLEKMGEVGGIVGSRVVIFDLNGRQVCAYRDFLRDDFIRIMVCDGVLYGVLRSGKNCQLAEIDWRAGRIKQRSKPFWGLDLTVVRRGGNFFILPRGSRELTILDGADLGGSERRIKLPEAAMLAAVSGDGRDFAVATATELAFFRIMENVVVDWRKITLPEGFVPDKMWSSADPQKRLLLADSGNGMCLGGKEAIERLPGRFRGIAEVTNGGDGVIFLERSDSFVLLDSARGVGSRTFSPGRLKPRTVGDVLWIFTVAPRGENIVMVDHRGNIFRVKMQGKRFVKELLFTAS